MSHFSHSCRGVTFSEVLLQLHFEQSLFLIKLQAWGLKTLFKKRFWHSCFLVNFAKFLRTNFYRTLSVAASAATRPISKMKVEEIILNYRNFSWLKCFLWWYFRIYIRLFSDSIPRKLKSCFKMHGLQIILLSPSYGRILNIFSPSFT